MLPRLTWKSKKSLAKCWWNRTQSPYIVAGITSLEDESDMPLPLIDLSKKSSRSSVLIPILVKKYFLTKTRDKKMSTTENVNCHNYIKLKAQVFMCTSLTSFSWIFEEHFHRICCLHVDTRVEGTSNCIEMKYQLSVIIRNHKNSYIVFFFSPTEKQWWINFK